MAAPQLTRFVTGQGATTGDMLNTFAQTCDTYAQLRAFVGTTGIQVFARGTAAPNDGGQSFFYWDSSAIGPDNNFTIIIPPAAASGGWVRITESNAGFFYAVDTGSVNSLAITLPQGLAALPVGTIIIVNAAHTTTTTTPTLSVNGSTPVTITDPLGNPLLIGAIVAGEPAQIMIGAGGALWLLNPGGASLGPYATAVVGQLPGTATNDDAAAGMIGEFISSTIPAGSAVSLTNGSTSNITSITLTPGDWDVWGNVLFGPGGGAMITGVICGVSASSGSIGTPAAADAASYFGLEGSFGNIVYMPISPIRASLNANTAYYLLGNCEFSGGTVGAYGFIAARRVR
jgi:hypothetical protein